MTTRTATSMTPISDDEIAVLGGYGGNTNLGDVLMLRVGDDGKISVREEFDYTRNFGFVSWSNQTALG